MPPRRDQRPGAARRAVLLVVLPDGSRSLIPSAWTDWLGSCGVDAPGEVKAARTFAQWVI